MKQKMMIRQIDNDAATKCDLEKLTNALDQFRSVVQHISALNEREARPIAWQLEQARERQRSAHRRRALEWVVAAVMCLAVALPLTGRYHSQALQARAQQQLLQQRTADAALLDQVASEIEEPVPDAMRPLEDSDSVYATDSSVQQGDKNNGRN